MGTTTASLFPVKEYGKVHFVGNAAIFIPFLFLLMLVFGCGIVLALELRMTCGHLPLRCDLCGSLLDITMAKEGCPSWLPSIYRSPPFMPVDLCPTPPLFSAWPLRKFSSLLPGLGSRIKRIQGLLLTQCVWTVASWMWSVF
jgi:hypothetical protein